jgi:serine/threonine-protein kinase RsbW
MECGTISIAIPSDARYVIVARQAIDGVAQRTTLNCEQIHDLKLAIGEACSNAVKFAAPDASIVNILCNLKPDRLEIEVINKGDGFCPPCPITAKPDSRRLLEGGLGLYLISLMVDEMDIKCDSGRTTVRMVKLLNNEQQI